VDTKYFFVRSEMEAAKKWMGGNDADALDEINLVFGDQVRGGCKWEFSVELRRLSDEGNTAMELKVFDDAFVVFREAPEVFATLEKFHCQGSKKDRREDWPRLVEALEKAGWIHRRPEDERPNRFPPFKPGSTIGDMYGPAMDLKTHEEAVEYFERLVEYGMSQGQSRERAEEVQRSNLGYFTGYYDQETAARVFKLFRCAHPLFGTARPDAMTAFKKGLEKGASEAEVRER